MSILTDPWRDASDLRRLQPAPLPELLEAPGRDPGAIEKWPVARYPLLQFVEEAWLIAEKRPYQPNWHIEAICLHLEAVFEGNIRRLLLNAPPRMGKSSVLCVLFPVWCWIMDPTLRLLYFSYAQDLAMRDARKARDLIESPWFKQRWGDRVEIDPHINRVLRYANTAGGQRVTSSVGGLATGEGGDIVCIKKNQFIMTDMGNVEIGEIVEQRLPVKVLSYDHMMGQTTWETIVAYHATAAPTSPMVSLRLDTGTVVTLTVNHPVYALTRGYVAAQWLAPGDLVCVAEEGLIAVRAVVTLLPAPAESVVYNLTTTGPHNFFAEGLLVHNCGDDLHHVSEADSETRAEIDSAADFWMTAVQTRFNNFTTAREIVAGQRIAVDDVSARIIANQSHVHLSIPMEYIPPLPTEEPPVPNPIGWRDPRTHMGELMFPERFGPDATAHLKKTLRHKWFAQFQQQPHMASETLFPRDKWQHYTEMPPRDWFDIIVQSWDMRFKEEKQSGSFVAGHIWGRKGQYLYLLDRVFERFSFPESMDAVKKMTDLWPEAHGKLIENKANGPAIVQSLRTQVAGLVLTEPEGGKYARAQAVAFLQQSGQVWIPSSKLCPWVEDYISHMERFPAPPDDDTDASTQAWRKIMPFRPATDTVRIEAQSRHDQMRAKMRALREQQSALVLSRTGA